MGMLGDPDPLKAAELYRRAAEAGSPEAAAAIGNIYSRGLETEAGRIDPDHALARSWYERAAAGGIPRAMVEIGKMHLYSAFDGADPKKGLEYLLAAAARGEEEALEMLAPDMAKAARWEAERPGRKANFPTSRETAIKPELIKQAADRNAALSRTADRALAEINRRLSAATRDLSGSGGRK